MELPPKHSRLFEYMDAKGCGVALTQIFQTLGMWMPGAGVTLPTKPLSHTKQGNPRLVPQGVAVGDMRSRG